VRQPWCGEKDSRQEIKGTKEGDGVCKGKGEMAVTEGRLRFALGPLIYKPLRDLGPNGL
jgi:hypothetical protein